MIGGEGRMEGSGFTQESMRGRGSDEVICKGKEGGGRCDRDAKRAYSASTKAKERDGGRDGVIEE